MNNTFRAILLAICLTFFCSAGKAEAGDLPEWSLIHSFQSNGELCAIIWYEGNEERHYQQGVLINIPSWIWTCGGHNIDYKPTGKRWSFLMLPSHYEGFLKSYGIDPDKVIAAEGAELMDLGRVSDAFEPLSETRKASFISWGRKWEHQDQWEVIKVKVDPPVWRKVPLRSEVLDLTPEQLKAIIRVERERKTQKEESDER